MACDSGIEAALSTPLIERQITTVSPARKGENDCSPPKKERNHPASHVFLKSLEMASTFNVLEARGFPVRESPTVCPADPPPPPKGKEATEMTLGRTVEADAAESRKEKETLSSCRGGFW